MQAVILAGGLATRLRPLTEKIPKSMVPVLQKPFLEYQLDFLRKNGVTEVVLCVGHLSEIIIEHFSNGEKFGINIKYSSESEKLLGTAGAIKNAEKLLSEEFFVMYGDSYVFLDLCEVMQTFRNSDKLALMTVYKNYDKYDRSNVAVAGNRITKYSKKEKALDMVYIDYGVSILRKKVLDFIPKGKSYQLDELISELISKKELIAYEASKRFYEIGSYKGLEEFRSYIKEIEGQR